MHFQPDVPEQHAETYSEMCEQFMRAVLEKYTEASRLTIMRDLPPALQINALLVGSTVGALIPMLLLTANRTDDVIVEAMRKQMPLIVAEARKRADKIKDLS